MLKNTKHPGKIIFDMDGVIIGEGCYWNAASLVVFELLYSKRYLGLPPQEGVPAFKTALTPREIAEIRSNIFQEDRVVAFFKQKAVNSNWDIAFLTFAFQLVLILKHLALHNKGGKKASAFGGEKGLTLEDLPLVSERLASLPYPWSPSFQSVLGSWAADAWGMDLMKKLVLPLTGAYKELALRSFQPLSPLWKGVRDVFQEWYLGDEKYCEAYGKKPGAPGKKGLIEDEEPLLPVNQVRDTLQQLHKKGWSLGIATGRPLNELYPPLKQMGIWELFEQGSIVTFNDVQKAEQELKNQRSNLSLGKPHPFPFLKAYWGESYSDSRLISPSGLRPQAGKCWIVGDTMADLLAAREMGAFFIGVLTGPSGPEIINTFKKEGASAVLPDITGLPRFFEENAPRIIHLQNGPFLY